MKSIKEISWLVDEPTYRANDALSFSSISKFYREGFSKLDHLFDKEESPSLTFGSIVDCLLTEGEERFNEKYFVCVVPIISDDYKLVVNVIKEELGNIHKSLYDIPDKTIVEYLDRFGIYQNNWKPDTKANKIREGANTYYKMLLESNGKEVVSKEIYENALACVEMFKSSNATEFYFREDNPFDKIERCHQLKFKSSYNKIDIKCMMDLIVVDNNKKTIQPCDIKTMSEEEYNFPRSFMKWQYYWQAQIYTWILKQNIAKDDYFKDFKVLDFKFIVISNNTKTPLVWTCSFAGAETEIKIQGKTRDIIIPNWREYLIDLDMYLKLKPKTPRNISEFLPNSILNALEEW